MKTRTRKEVYKLWIAALRSGKYKQGKGSLKEGNKYCCLGVLCDLAIKDGGGDKEQWKKGDMFLDYYDILPPNMWEWMNMSCAQETALINMNDIHNASFKHIANFIEKKVMPVACRTTKE